MIERIIDYSARNPLIIILLVACLAGWGLWSIAHIPLDAIPDLSDLAQIDEGGAGAVDGGLSRLQ